MSLSTLDQALITLGQAKTYLGVNDTGSDARLNALIQQCSGEISAHCGRKFASATYTDEKHTGNGTEILYLKAWPVTTMTTLYEDATRAFTGSALVNATSQNTGDYVVLPNEEGYGQVIRIGGVWSTAPLSIKATYVAGYSTIPDPVQLAALRLVAYRWNIAKRGLDAQTSESIAVGGGSTSITEHRVPQDVRDLLTPYKRIVFMGA